MINVLKIKCEICGLEFERNQSEINRNKKKGRRIFCSKSCAGQQHINNIPKESRCEYDISQHAGNRKTEFSPFKWHLRNCIQHSENRKIKREVSITLKDLKIQWDLQDGKCPYTGWSLLQIPDTSHKKQLPKTPDRASLDRIDSSKGYVPGNIQFVSIMAQFAKNSFTEQQLLEFCESVVHNKTSVLKLT